MCVTFLLPSGIKKLNFNKIQEGEMEENFRRKQLRRVKLSMKKTVNGRNTIMAVDTCVVSLMR